MEITLKREPDNMTKLKLLVDKMSRNEYSELRQDSLIMIKKIIDTDNSRLTCLRTKNAKIKAYENMYSKIKIILEKIKIIDDVE
jgi:hypothetical protein